MYQSIFIKIKVSIEKKHEHQKTSCDPVDSRVEGRDRKQKLRDGELITVGTVYTVHSMNWTKTFLHMSELIYLDIYIRRRSKQAGIVD